MMYHTYVLQSEKDQSYYIGQTSDLEERIKRHNAGYESYTKNKGPWKLVWSRSFETRAEAIQLERKLKNLKSRIRLHQFISSN